MPPSTQRITNEMNKQTQTILAISMSPSRQELRTETPKKNLKSIKGGVNTTFIMRSERKLLSYTESFILIFDK